MEKARWNTAVDPRDPNEPIGAEERAVFGEIALDGKAKVYFALHLLPDL